jgi:hypothetical protein
MDTNRVHSSQLLSRLLAMGCARFHIRRRLLLMSSLLSGRWGCETSWLRRRVPFGFAGGASSLICPRTARARCTIASGWWVIQRYWWADQSTFSCHQPQARRPPRQQSRTSHTAMLCSGEPNSRNGGSARPPSCRIITPEHESPFSLALRCWLLPQAQGTEISARGISAARQALPHDG